ncbi:hypothetical protein [Tsukamurella sp. NPDC003166]|uniref:hypothetical protein n=1 Tax=Tsukamurella sp. NPDC003166 TaxID=3154444 RepID=UPI0033B4DBFD
MGIEETSVKLVYLHGVGSGDVGGNWLTGLNFGLQHIGAAPVTAADVLAPRYSNHLHGLRPAVDHPAITYAEQDDADARRAFTARQARLAERIRRFEGVRGLAFTDVPKGLVDRVQTIGLDHAVLGALKQVQNYLTDEGVRATVLQHILDELPTDDGDIVLVGHSLGSIIAIDLLDHLPPDLHVRRFVTIGSPGGNETLHRAPDRILRRFPYSRVGDWSNFIDPLDPVTAGRGLSDVFPEANDFWIGGGAGHLASMYTSHPAFATIIDDALQRTVDAAEARPRLSDADAGTLLTLAYLGVMSESVAGSAAREKFDGVVSMLRRSYVEEIEHRVGELPPELAELVAGNMPELPARWTLRDAVTQIVQLAYSDLVAPYGIDITDAAIDAIPTILRRLGFPDAVGEQVRTGVRRVDDRLGPKPLFRTRTRLALIATAGLLAATGPLGVGACRAPGTRGIGAARTGLARFGPGGVAGGLAAVGGLALAGVVTAIIALARPGSYAVFADPTAVRVQVAIAQCLRDLGVAESPAPAAAGREHRERASDAQEGGKV